MMKWCVQTGITATVCNDLDNATVATISAHRFVQIRFSHADNTNITRRKREMIRK